MPPTLEEILIAIQTATTARQQELGAETAYNTINAQVAANTATEQATFDAQTATYEAALTTARNGLGWPAALAQLQAAYGARAQAEANVLNLMAAYVAATPA